MAVAGSSYAGPLVRAGRLGALSGAAQQALSVVGTVVVVRILEPESVGLVAMATVLAGVLAVLSQVGIAQTLVRRPSVEDRETSTLFWLAVLLGSILAGAAYAGADGLAAAMGAPAAAPLVRILAPAVLFHLAASVPRALLQRRMLFGRIYLNEVSYSLVYVVLQIGLVVNGWGAAGVVAAQTTAAAYSLLLLLCLARWRPRWQFSLHLVRHELSFSGGVLAVAVLSFTSKNVDYVVLGRGSGAAVLGIYYVAFVLPQILRQRVTWIVSDLLLPVLARLADDDVRTRRAVGRALNLQVFLGAPAALGLAAGAAPVVALFFGDGWSAAVHPMRILALAALFEFVTQAMLPLFLARGVVRNNIGVEAVRLVVLLVGLPAVVAAGGDASAVAAVVATASAAAMCVVLRRGLSTGLLHVRDLGRCAISVVAAGAAGAAVLAGASQLDEASPVAQLLLLLPLGVVVYGAAAWLLHREHLASMLRDLFPAVATRGARQVAGEPDADTSGRR